MNKETNNRIPRPIFAVVLVGHAFLCYLLFFQGMSSKPQKMSPQPIKIAYKMLEVPKPVTQTKKVAVAKPVTQTKKVEAVKPKPTPAPKKVVPQTPKQNEMNAKKEIVTAAIAKIEPAPKEFIKSEPIEMPKTMDTLHIEKKEDKEQTEITPFERNYQRQLVSFLEAFLTLPREGQITIELTLNSKGEILRKKVTKVSDKSVQFYIESQLEKIKFPPFHHELSQQKEHTFLLTFSSKGL